MSRQIVLDTETTGLSTKDGHRIIEVGCLELVNRRITGDYYHQYINPEREIDAGAQNVHGITSAFLTDKPKFAEIAGQLLDYIDGAELIIHNAPFDIGFLNYEYSLINKKHKRIDKISHVIDTLTLARGKHPGQQNNLDALCKRYSVDNSNRELHGALLDAELLAKVYLYMTGGQTQLFVEDEAQNSMEQQSDHIKPLCSPRKTLPIIQPMAEEADLHVAMLEKMQAAGKCLWKA